jgi:tetratricopeptide (TPR) repeat protein
MKLFGLALALAIASGSAASQQPPAPSPLRLALYGHAGLLTWKADGFKITEASAKPDGRELGVRTEDTHGRLHSLGFLLAVPEFAPLTSAKCRDATLASDAKDNPSLKILRTLELPRGSGPPVALAIYTAQGRRGPGYLVRGFIATDDLCGDLEFDSIEPIRETDADLAAIFASYQLDPAYTPAFVDVFQYAQVLYQTDQLKAAAPVFEKALAMMPPDGAPFVSKKVAVRVVTDQTATSYGAAGNLAKARSILNAAIAADPEYPLYYYNLACADAGEKNLAAARRHLQQAFARRGNVNPGESMPDPTGDDSFQPYKGNKEFWSFLAGLNGGQL